MRFALLSFVLLSSPAFAVETFVDSFISSSVGYCDARVEASQNTFDLYDAGEFMAIERRISLRDDYAKLMIKARNQASKNQKTRQLYLLKQFSECVDERTKLVINILRK